MSFKFQRYENPNPGKTLLLHQYEPWKDPRKVAPEAPLESEKGMFLPTWKGITFATGSYFLLTAFQHMRMRGI